MSGTITGVKNALNSADNRFVVIGGGPAGYEAALTAAQLGAEVMLIERAHYGGAAVLTDVVPSKTLIATAELMVDISNAETLGIRVPQTDPDPDSGAATGEDERARSAQAAQSLPKPAVSADLAAINSRIRSLASAQSQDIEQGLAAAGVKTIKGTARLCGPARVAVSEDSGAEYELSATNILLAVGAHPRVLGTAQPDGERILTWTQLYELDELPEHLVVVGSGVTGAEFASAYHALGCEVTLVSSRTRVLPGEDADAAELLENTFRSRGMNVLSRSRAASATRSGDGVVVSLEDGRKVHASHCLMAVGSIPNTADLGLEELNMRVQDSGHIEVDGVSRTSVPGVYAAGDCTAVLPLASVAAMQGRIAVFHALGDAVTPLRLRNVASNVFTAPEIATVGFTQVDHANSRDVEAVTQQLSTNPRAKMLGISEGFVKIYARKESGSVMGGVVVGPKASELILPITMAVENRLTVDQLAQSFAVYPSLSGSISEAARKLHRYQA